LITRVFQNKSIIGYLKYILNLLLCLIMYIILPLILSKKLVNQSTFLINSC